VKDMKNVFDKINLGLTSAVLAADEVNIKPPTPEIGKITIQSLVSGVIGLVFIAASLIFFFLLMAGGIKWMMAGGDKEKAGEARGQLTSALIGLVVVFIAWAVSTQIGNIFGFNLLELEIPTFY
jgi:hypothetical protein